MKNREATAWACEAMNATCRAFQGCSAERNLASWEILRLLGESDRANY